MSDTYANLHCDHRNRSYLLLLKKTALGLYIESVRYQWYRIQLVGLNSTMIKFLAYVICGLMAGIAGVVASSRIYSADANNIG